ncbi:transmembrane protein [Arabidopsis thaliana]|uniref:Transmembrane protein n=1 Tax=Arabidopsis thaliana TaxID=3702 RepID=A0A1P8BEV7_ARATH|nr:uncharacterized protein AT5G43068 [Arabidopsis thaliana]ANM70097.1 transmembrane protein [Arabidopsis thaliana]|eukprot:NP_001331732.1 transmembrane protein [Arabidopsis thaliana]
MEKKNVFLLFVIFLLVGSSLMFERVDCRALRSKALRDIKGHDQSSVIMKVKNNSTSQRPLGKSFAYRLASGPSRRGRGH